MAFQHQRPYTAPDCSNVRPDDTIDGRERGGSRPGLKKEYSTQLGSGNKVRLLQDVNWISGGALTNLFLASANGVLYRDVAGTLTAVSSAVTLASDRQLGACEFLQNVYIIGDNHANRRLSVYDPSANTLANVTASAGTIPTTCTLICEWRGRIVLAGQSATPQNWYMSQQNDPTEWDYAVDDESAAVSGSATTLARIGEPIMALIPHSNDCLIFGCTNSLWVLRGDPNAGGSMLNLSPKFGVLGSHAWCYDDLGFLWFLSNDGLYVMPPGCGSTPTSVSREKLPEDLLNIDRSLHTVSLAYDVAHRGLHILVSANTAGATTKHYWAATRWSYQGQGGGQATFWPVTLGHTDCDPFFAYSRRNYVPGAGESEVMLGSRIGYVLTHDLAIAQDDGNAISSYVDYGPLPLGPPGYEGVVSELQVTTATGSGDVDVDVKVGKTAEAAAAASAFGTYENNTAGLNLTHRPRARGAAAVLRVKNGEANAAWAVEDVLVRRTVAGLRRSA